MPTDDERDSLFPDWVREKDLQDALFHVLVAFDPSYPGYSPHFQKSAVIGVREVLGLDHQAASRALDAEVLASPTCVAAPIYGPPLAGS